jgi:hypothetical protein
VNFSHQARRLGGASGVTTPSRPEGRPKLQAVISNSNVALISELRESMTHHIHNASAHHSDLVVCSWHRCMSFEYFFTPFRPGSLQLAPLHVLWIFFFELHEHLRRPCRQILKIDEVTTGASLSTGTLPTTESTNAVKSWEIRSHGESNPGPEVLPRLL